MEPGQEHHHPGASLRAHPSVAALGELLPDGLVVIDAGGTILFVNSEAGRILDVRPGDLVDLPVASALPLTDRDGRDWWTSNDPWATPDSVMGHREALLRGPNDVRYFVTGRYLRDQSGEILRVVLGLRAWAGRITEDREQATILSTVAHELRAPLTSVTGFTSSLLRRWERFTDAQKRLMIETIQSDASRLTRLITELLDLSRLDADTLNLRVLPVDLYELLSSHIFRLDLASGPADVVLTLGPRADRLGLPEFWADRDRLEQVFFNLLENATRHGGAPVTVTLERQDSATDPVGGATQVLVIVDDSGTGVPEADRDHVFHRFWHGEHSSTTGLGLNVVQGLVRAHGGTVTVSDSPAGGARFTVTLPAGVPDDVTWS